MYFPVITQDCKILFVFPNEQCFVNSYQNCITAKISKTITTVEGDPLFYYANIVKKDGNSCKIEYILDQTQDKFSSGEIEHHVCNDVKISENGVVFQCEEGNYGFPK